jgi:hypothetical protein
MPYLIRFPSHADARGLLTVAQEALPFRPVRVFWITGAGEKSRGGHRHRLTETVLVAVHGTVSVRVQTPTTSSAYLLDAPSTGLYLAPEDWHTMAFGASSVLLAIASRVYDPADYLSEPYRDDPTEPDRHPL